MTVNLPNERMLGYRVTSAQREACIRQIFRWLKSGKNKRCFACVNPHSLMVARKDLTFKEALQNADLLIPDGFGVVIASMILGGESTSVESRVYSVSVHSAGVAE